MKPPIVFSPIVNRARKFLKIGNRSDTVQGRQTNKGISFENDVYQQTCQPIETLNNGSRRSSISSWYRSSASNVPAEEQSSSPRSSVRVYDSLWGRKSERKISAKCNDYEEVDEFSEPPKMDEGIFTFELIKPPNGYLGLVLVGGTDTPLQKHYIKDILPNSTASKDGSLRIGDEIIEVNGHSLRGRTHSLALAVIHSLPPLIKIVIERSKDANHSILSSCLYQEDFEKVDAGADPNITSPKARTRKRSVLQVANDTSIINKSVNSVINIQRTGSSASIKPAKLLRRESRCTSFIGDDDSEDDDEVITFECEETKSVKEGGVPEENSDYEDRLSMLSNTSAWCARQMMNCKSEDQTSTHQDIDSITDSTSVFSMSTLSDSLPPPYTEQEPPQEQSSFTRYGSLRMSRRVVTESIIEVDSDEEEEKVPEEPAMFLRRGSLRVRGSFSLREAGCEESEEERTTWPTTARRQRTSLNWDTFVPPPNKPLRRSNSACVRRPSSMYTTDNVPTSTTQQRIPEEAKNVNSRKLQRTNSGRFIDKRTMTTKVYRVPNTGQWALTIAGGSYSPYGDLPIHVLHIQDSLFAGLLKEGDEIVSFGGENFSNVTFLEADRKMRNIEGNCVTVIAKRKFLQRKKTQICTTYGDAWNEQARTARRLKTRPESLYC